MRIRIRCADVESFVEKYRRFVKEDRIFLITSSARPVGAKLRFVLELVDGTKLIAGEGEVLEVRPDTGNPARPPGLRLRFRPLDVESEALVGRMQARGDGGSSSQIVLGRLATRRSLPSVEGVGTAGARDDAQKQAAARLRSDGITEPMSVAEPEPIVVPLKPPTQAQVAAVPRPSAETSFESLLDEPTVEDADVPQPPSAAGAASTVTSIERHGPARGDEETTGTFSVTTGASSTGVTFDESKGEVPANPFGSVPDAAIEYFVEWSAEQNTKPGDSGAPVTKFANVPMLSPKVEATPPAGGPSLAASQHAAAQAAGAKAEAVASAVPSRPTERRVSGFLVGAVAGLIVGVPLGALLFGALREPPRSDAPLAAAPSPASAKAQSPTPGPASAPTAAATPAATAAPAPSSPAVPSPAPSGAAPAAPPSTVTPTSAAPASAAKPAAPPPVAVAPSPSAASAEKAPAKGEATPPVAAASAAATGEEHVGRGMALLVISSTPSGATVKLDGEARGETPFTVALPADHRHQIDVELAGHQAFHRRVNVKGPTTKLELSLAPQ